MAKVFGHLSMYFPILILNSASNWPTMLYQPLHMHMLTWVYNHEPNHYKNLFKVYSRVSGGGKLLEVFPAQ